MIEKPNMSAWERLSNPLTTERSSAYRFSAAYMPHLLKKLGELFPNSARYTFQGVIDAGNAQNIASYIRSNFDPYKVNAAHSACINDMKASPRRYSSKPRMNMRTGKVEDAPEVENALFEDDTPRDQAWLDEQVNNKPDTAMAAAIQKAQSVKDNAEYALKGYVDANFATKLNLGDAIHKQQQFLAEGITRLKTGIAADIVALNNAIVALDAALTEVKNSKPTIIELKRPELPETTKLGVQHKQFPVLLRMAQARENIWVYGPAGTGKSTAGEMLAVALFNDKAKFFTNGKMENQFEVLGYRNAAGIYQTTQFREAYENGGVYMADEIDGSMPSAVLALNGALANGHCPFPDKTVARHPDFIFIGAANTTGMGGTIEYVGRMKHDAAFLDRFVTLDWPLDLGLEDAITPNKAWLAYVRATRINLEKNPIKGHLITPRASIKGSNLLAYGVEPANVIKATLQKGLSDTQWNQIKPSVSYQSCVDALSR